MSGRLRGRGLRGRVVVSTVVRRGLPGGMRPGVSPEVAGFHVIHGIAVRGGSRETVLVAGRLQVLGEQGEDRAVAYLTGQGMQLVARNWRSRIGELDIVVRDGGVLVFVEVKLRRGAFDPLEAVDLRKQQQLARVAADYLLREGGEPDWVRFDVVAVDGVTLACTHVRNAFEAPPW